MCRYETMWTFETAQFRVTWAIAPCADLDLSWDETGETADNLDRGVWTAFDSRVAVYHRGRMIGSDYLGQSIYADPEDFRTEGGYFRDMVRTAIAEARAELAKPLPRMRATAAA